MQRRMTEMLLWPVLIGVMTTLISAPAAFASNASPGLVINEVMYGDSHATSHEFVEVRNLSDEDIHADLYEIRFQGASTSTGLPSATVNVLYTFPVGSIVPAKGYWLVVSDTYAAHDQHKNTPRNGVFSVEFSGSINASGGVGLYNRAGFRVDSVGWGAATSAHPMVEIAPAPYFSPGASIERVEAADTDDNSVDFAITMEPSPTSSPYTPDVPLVSVSVNPNRLDPGSTTQVTATVTATQNPVADVTMDLTFIGGPVDAPLTHSSGNVWTGSFTVPQDQAAGPDVLIVRANDTGNKYGTGGASVFVYPGPPITVAAARAAEPNTGELVRVRGVVMSHRTGLVYITDAGQNAGIAISDGNVRDGVAPVETGDDVIVTGRIRRDIWYSSTNPSLVIFQGERIVDTATGTADDFVVNSKGNPIPAPQVITMNELLSDQALTGTLVELASVTILENPAKVAASTGENTQVLRVNTAPAVWMGIPRSATDKAALPYPGLADRPIPAALDTNFYLPWIAVNDAFRVRGIVGRDSRAYVVNGVYSDPPVIRVRDATDFVLLNGAKVIGGDSVPAPAERGTPARIRVQAYPVDTATVSVNLAPLGLGSVSLPADDEGTYSTIVTIPAGAPLGQTTVSASASANGQSASGTFAITVAERMVNPGDVDRSGGSPTMADALMALRVAGGLLAGDGITASVINGDVFPNDAPDGALTLGDATRILRAVHGLDTL